MQTDIKEKFIRASLWSGAATYFFFVFNFLFQWVFSRLLSPTDMGIFAFGIAIREMIGMVCVIVTPGGYIKSKGEQIDFDAYMMLTWLALFAQLFMTLILSSYYFIEHHSTQVALVILLLGISQIFILLGYVYMATLEKKLEYKSISILQGLSNLLTGIIAIFIAYYFHTVYALVVRDLLAAAILWYLIRKKTNINFHLNWNKNAIKNQFIFGVKWALIRVSEVGYYRIPELLISFLLSKTSLGYFYQGRYLAYFPIKLFQPFTNSILFSYFAHHENDKTGLEKQFWWISYIAIRVLVPICGLIYLFGSKFIVFFYGHQWLIAGECFSYFSIFILAGVLLAIAINMANLLGKQAYVVQAYCMALALFLSGLFKFHSVVDLAFLFSFALFLAVIYLTIRLLLSRVLKNLFSLYYPVLISLATFVFSYDYHFSLLTAAGLFFIFLAMCYIAEYRNIVKLTKQLVFLTRKKAF